MSLLSVHNFWSQSVEKYSGITFYWSNLVQYFSRMLDLELADLSYHGKWSEIDNVKLRDVLLGNIIFEKILSIRALKSSLTLVDWRIWGRIKWKDRVVRNLFVDVFIIILKVYVKVPKEENSLIFYGKFIQKIISIIFIKFIKIDVWMLINTSSNNINLFRVTNFNESWFKFKWFENPWVFSEFLWKMISYVQQSATSW